MIAAATVSANPFGVLVPMLPLGFVGLWGARTACSGPEPASSPRSDRLRPQRGERPARRTSDGRQASERIRIDAPADRCFDVAVDFESYPEWVRDVKEATILERDDEGRGAQVEFRAAALGKSIRYVLEYDYSERRTRSRGSSSKATCCAGSTAPTASSPRADSTRVHYDLAVELAMPLPGLVKRRAAGLIMGSALKELKKQVEAVASRRRAAGCAL